MTSLSGGNMSCCCFCSNENDPSRAPLLKNSNRHKTYIVEQPQSARKYKSPQVAHETPLILPIECKRVKVSNVDKRLQDHAQLFNEHLIRNQRRKDAIEQLKEMGVEERTLDACFIRLRQYKGNPDGFRVKRKSEYCIEVEFEPKEVDYRLAAAFSPFNTANKLTKQILDTGPSLVQSITLVTSSENELRRDVLVASLGEEGPECMKNCMDNIAQLRKAPGVAEAVRQETEEDFEKLKRAMQLFMEDDPPAHDTHEDKTDDVIVDLQTDISPHNGTGSGSDRMTNGEVTQNLFAPE